LSNILKLTSRVFIDQTQKDYQQIVFSNYFQIRLFYQF